MSEISVRCAPLPFETCGGSVFKNAAGDDERNARLFVNNVGELPNTL